MTRPKHVCGHCGSQLPDGRARFEVHVAQDHQAKEGMVVGVFCNAVCWLAARDGKAGTAAAKVLISDVETVLGSEEKIAGERYVR